MSFANTSKLAIVFAAVAVGAALLAIPADARTKGAGGGGGGVDRGSASGGFKGGGAVKPTGPVSPSPGKSGSFKPKPPQCLGLGCTTPKPPHKPPHKHGHRRWFWGGSTIHAGDYGGCGYEYYKWKSTGSRYWYARYRDCIAS